MTEESNQDEDNSDNQDGATRDTILGFVVISAVFFWIISDDEWEEKGFVSEEQFELALESGFETRSNYEKAQSLGLSSPTALTEWEETQKKEEAAELERIRKEEAAELERIRKEAPTSILKGGETRIVEYTCDYDPQQKRRTQPFYFPISAAEAEEKVWHQCKIINIRRGGGRGGVKIISNVP